MHSVDLITHYQPQYDMMGWPPHYSSRKNRHSGQSLVSSQKGGKARPYVNFSSACDQSAEIASNRQQIGYPLVGSEGKAMENVRCATVIVA